MQKEILAHLSENPGTEYADILSHFAPRCHKAGYPKGYSNYAVVYHALEKLHKKGKIRNEGRKFFVVNLPNTACTGQRRSRS